MMSGVVEEIKTTLGSERVIPPTLQCCKEEEKLNVEIFNLLHILHVYILQYLLYITKTLQLSVTQCVIVYCVINYSITYTTQ